MDQIWEQGTLVNELMQGMEMAKQLMSHVKSSTSYSTETQQFLLQKILSSYQNALSILNSNGCSAVQPHQLVAAKGAAPESPVSTDGSKDHPEHIDVSKKRKALSTWKGQVKICSDNGMEGSVDDGYSWRKYGQKDILGATYPRSYYRCTYRNTQTCYATKQVQRSDDDSTIFQITYKGKHTCHQASPSVLPPASPEKQEEKQKNQHQSNNHHQQQQSNNIIFKEHLRVNTEDLDKKETSDLFSFSSGTRCMTSNNQICSFSRLVDENTMGNFSPFISPATSGSSYFSVSPYQINSFGHFSESDHTEIVSANTSNTNSPILDLDFAIDQVHIDPDFPFSMPEFLP